MRVIAGTARHLVLKTPSGRSTRPTTDRIKETLFNMIAFDMPGCVFVDLFSGSGSIGIEALSRGAKKAYFVENNREALSCIKDNLLHTRLSEKAVVMAGDAARAVLSLSEQKVCADFIFMDPPYGTGNEQEILSLLRTSSLCGPDTTVIVETDLDTDFSYLDSFGFTLTKEKIYKTNRHLFLKKTDQ